MTINKVYKEFAEKVHGETNHFYNKYLPYKFHLEMVNVVFHKFKHLLNPIELYTLQIYEAAGWCHDVIEDCRVTYNDLKNLHPNGSQVADIVFALTNNKGKTRSERANMDYYLGIINQPGAIYLKLCDRIANVQFGLISHSTMPKKYKEEGPEFFHNSYIPEYSEMFKYLDELYTQIQ